jgi:hypothetical protein
MLPNEVAMGAEREVRVSRYAFVALTSLQVLTGWTDRFESDLSLRPIAEIERWYRCWCRRSTLGRLLGGVEVSGGITGRLGDLTPLFDEAGSASRVNWTRVQDLSTLGLGLFTETLATVWRCRLALSRAVGIADVDLSSINAHESWSRSNTSVRGAGGETIAHHSTCTI